MTSVTISTKRFNLYYCSKQKEKRMASTTMAFLIATIAIVFSVISKIFTRYFDYKKNSAKDAEDNAQLTNEIIALKKRIEVLEQIVTEDGYQVKQQFKSL